MTPDAKKPSFPTLLTHMVKTEGVSSIYAGLSAAIMRQAIYGTARIGLHRTFSDKLQEASSPVGLVARHSFAMVCVVARRVSRLLVRYIVLFWLGFSSAKADVVVSLCG